MLSMDQLLSKRPFPCEVFQSTGEAVIRIVRLIWFTRQTIAGWWLSPTPLKNDGVKVSWDDEIPTYPFAILNLTITGWWYT